MTRPRGFAPHPHPLFEKSGAKTLTLRIQADTESRASSRFNVKVFCFFFSKKKKSFDL
jgi:hypothetical protein